MAELFCNFKELEYKNETNGKCKYTVTIKDENNKTKKITCFGLYENFEVGMPLNLKGNLSENKKTFFVQEIKAFNSNDKTALAFLISIKDIKKAQREQILEAMKERKFDIFTAFTTTDVDFVETIDSIIDPKVHNKIRRTIKKYSVFKDLVNFVVGFGGQYEKVIDIYNSFKEKSLECMKKNPYIMLEANVPLKQCEKLAYKQGMRATDERRVSRIVDYIMQRNHNNGSTCIYFSDLCRRFRRIENYNGSGYVTYPFFIKASLMCSKYRIVDDTVYLTDDYNNERDIMQNAQRIDSAKRLNEDVDIDKIIDEVQREIGITYEDSQKRPFEILKEKGGLSIICGGPGTGKTTIIKGLIKGYKKIYPDDKIALAAPTAAASKRIRETSGETAQTVHKLLDIRPFDVDILKSKNEFDKIEFNLIIVDETSMCDNELMAILLKAVKNGTTLIFVGDPEQLPSVGAGAFLRDIINCHLFKYYELNTIFRQKDGNSIIENAYKIREGKCDLKTDDNTVIYYYKNEEEVRNKILEEIKKDDEGNTMLYTSVKQTKYYNGVKNLNNFLQEFYNKNIDTINSISCNGYNFNLGDKVVMTKNVSKKGYLNGDRGIVTYIDNTPRRRMMTVLLDDDVEVTLRGKDLENVELAYCLTIHKSQGSENERSIIVLPLDPKVLNSRQLLYVASTRAKKQNVFFVQRTEKRNALVEAIENDAIEYRQTGLFRFVRVSKK